MWLILEFHLSKGKWSQSTYTLPLGLITGCFLASFILSTILVAILLFSDIIFCSSDKGCGFCFFFCERYQSLRIDSFLYPFIVAQMNDIIYILGFLSRPSFFYSSFKHLLFMFIQVYDELISHGLYRVDLPSSSSQSFVSAGFRVGGMHLAFNSLGIES